MKAAAILVVLLLPGAAYAQEPPLFNRGTMTETAGSDTIPAASDSLGSLFRFRQERPPLQRLQDPDRAFGTNLHLRPGADSPDALSHQARGLGQPEVYINGFRTHLPDGMPGAYTPWMRLGGRISRPRHVPGLASASGLPPGLNGQTALELDPARHQASLRLQYGFSNALPGRHLRLIYHSGLRKSAWAWSVAANKRWARSGYIPGTFYSGYALYLGLRKGFGKKVLLNWNTLAAPGRRGLHQAATAEALALSNDPHYNPAWGYQEGSVRNAVVADNFLPESRLNLDWKTGDFGLLRLGFALRWGHRQLSGLDWYHTADPRPDYYKNLPSYHLRNGAPEAAEQLAVRWETEPDFRQVDWAQLYERNRTSYTLTNGTFGRRSVYVLGADRSDIRHYNLGLQFRSRPRLHMVWNSGLQFSAHSGRHYRKMLDLLGGDYFVNLNPFAERQFPDQPELHQNNLLQPNEIIKNGDAYAYHYRLRTRHSFGWTYIGLQKSRIYAALSGRAGLTAYQREGFYKHGIFPDDSQGPSALLQFFTYRVHGELRYRPGPAQHAWIRAAIQTSPPSAIHTFISPKVRNTLIGQPRAVQAELAETGYRLRLRRLQFELQGFVAQSRHLSRILRFYHEAYHSQVNYVLQGINRRHLGVELALRLMLSSKLEALAAGSWKQAFYTNRPRFSIYRDNDREALLRNGIVYLKNYYIGSGPQSAAFAGIRYRPFRGALLTLRAKHTGRHFIEMNPSRLTDGAVEQTEPGRPEWNAILAQQQLPPVFTLDVSLRQSIRLKINALKRHSILTLQIGINNLLNHTNVVQSAYQQLRFDFAGRDPQAFPEKYRFLPGRLWHVSFSWNF